MVVALGVGVEEVCVGGGSGVGFRPVVGESVQVPHEIIEAPGGGEVSGRVKERESEGRGWGGLGMGMCR